MSAELVTPDPNTGQPWFDPHSWRATLAAGAFLKATASKRKKSALFFGIPRPPKIDTPAEGEGKKARKEVSAIRPRDTRRLTLVALACFLFHYSFLFLLRADPGHAPPPSLRSTSALLIPPLKHIASKGRPQEFVLPSFTPTRQLAISFTVCNNPGPSGNKRTFRNHRHDGITSTAIDTLKPRHPDTSTPLRDTRI